MNFVLWRKLQLVSDRINFLGDGEGTNVSGTWLLAGQAHSDVPC